MNKSLPRPIDRNLWWIALLALILFPLGRLLGSHGGEDVLVGIGQALTGAGILLFAVAAGSRYHRLNVQEEEVLDEWELAQRYRTGAQAFRIYWAGTVIGAGYLYFAGRIGAPAPEGEDWIWIMLTLFMAFLLLPIILLEWARDPLIEEDEE